MKRLKKLLAFVISCTMIFGTMSMMSFADPTSTIPASEMVDPQYDETIQIMGLQAEDVVKLYKVLEWNGSAAADPGTTYGGWKFVSPFSGDTLGMKDDATAIEYIIGDPASTLQPVDPQLSSEIAGKLARIPGENDNPVDTQTVTGTTYEYAIGEDGLGLYMALITPADQNTVYNPIFISSDFNKTNPSSSWTVTSDETYWAPHAAKKSTVSVNKEDNGGDADHNSYDGTWTSVRPGETVDFTVTTTIPGYGSVYEEPKFTIHDKLSHMTLTGAPSVEPAEAAAGATISGDEGDDEYTIDFDPEYLKTLTTALTVTITYSAEIDENAPQNVNTKKNEVWIEYSHDPTNETDYDVKKDGTNHYTFTIDAKALGGFTDEIQRSGAEIVKVGVDAHGNPITDTEYWSDVEPGNGWQGPLEGAVFKLYTADGDGNITDTVYTSKGHTYDNIQSDEYGKITIEGLDAGTYYLVEDKAPSGYIRSTESVKVEIVPHFSEELETVTEYYQNGTWSFEKPESGEYKTATYDIQLLDSYEVLFNDAQIANYVFDHEGTTEIKVSDEGIVEIPTSINNTKGVELPATGGIGTTIFYVIGAILVLGAGILLVTRRRMDIG